MTNKLYIKGFEVIQWNKNGDHPLDECELVIPENGGESFLTEGKIVRYHRHPDVRSDKKCQCCGRTMIDHGWIDPSVVPFVKPEGLTVCPGTYILSFRKGGSLQKKDFRIYLLSPALAEFLAGSGNV